MTIRRRGDGLSDSPFGKGFAVTRQRRMGDVMIFTSDHGIVHVRSEKRTDQEETNERYKSDSIRAEFVSTAGLFLVRCLGFASGESSRIDRERALSINRTVDLIISFISRK